MKLRLPPETGPALVILAVGVLIWLATSEVGRVFELLERLESLVRERWWTALAIYIFVFVVLAASMLPVASLLCLVAGFLFGLGVGAGVALAAGILAATITFMLARKLGGERARARLGRTRAAALMEIFEREAVYYLVFLRVVPVAPFFMINAAAGLTTVPTPRYILATAVGLVPTTIVYAAVGSGLESLVRARELAGPRLLLQPQLGLPLAALAALLILAWWWRRRLAQMRRGDKQAAFRSDA